MTGLRHLLLALVAAGLALVLGVGLGVGPVTEDASRHWPGPCPTVP